LPLAGDRGRADRSVDAATATVSSTAPSRSTVDEFGERLAGVADDRAPNQPGAANARDSTRSAGPRCNAARTAPPVM